MASHLKPVDAERDHDVAVLLAGVVRGDPAALSAFFDRFEPLVNQLVWRMLGADAEHDDLVSEVFETIARKAKTITNPAAVEGWIRVVTVNTVRSCVRRRRWLSIFVPADQRTASHPDLNVPDEASRERIRILFHALSKLSFEDRTVLVLRHLEEMELTEVAQSMECSLATVKRLLSRAEQRLTLKLTGARP